METKILADEIYENIDNPLSKEAKEKIRKYWMGKVVVVQDHPIISMKFKKNGTQKDT